MKWGGDYEYSFVGFGSFIMFFDELLFTVSSWMSPLRFPWVTWTVGLKQITLEKELIQEVEMELHSRLAKPS